jgi:hypothetical protein
MNISIAMYTLLIPGGIRTHDHLGQSSPWGANITPGDHIFPLGAKLKICLRAPSWQFCFALIFLLPIRWIVRMTQKNVETLFFYSTIKSFLSDSLAFATWSTIMEEK